MARKGAFRLWGDLVDGNEDLKRVAAFVATRCALQSSQSRARLATS
jgi:hypothetical protein